MLRGVRVGDHAGKSLADCYYSYGIAWGGAPLSLPARGPGRWAPAKVYQLTRPYMGLPDSAGVGQSISSPIGLIRNARLLGLPTEAGAQAMMDDFTRHIPDEGHGPRVGQELEGLVAPASLK